LPSGYTKSAGFSLSPEIVQWIAPVALALSCLLTLFPWDGAYPGGYAAYHQNAWGALIGNFSTDKVAEKVLKLEDPGKDEKRLKDYVHWNFYMLPYLPLLGLATALAILSVLLPHLNLKIPPHMERYIPMRMFVVATVAFIMVLVLVTQMWSGFGLENGLQTAMKERYEKAEPPAKDPEKLTDEDVKKQEITRAITTDGLNIRQTTWVCLALILDLIAVIGAYGAFALHYRQGQPWPRLQFSW
jgi:hypothetical protein